MKNKILITYAEPKPGMNDKPFIITFNESFILKKEMIIESTSFKFKITKVYKFQWLRLLLCRLGFSIAFYEGKIIKE